MRASNIRKVISRESPAVVTLGNVLARSEGS